MVENDPRKQIYLSERFHGPIIHDVKDLGRPAASTYGGGETTVPKAGHAGRIQMKSITDKMLNSPIKPHRGEVDLLVGGFPCKSVSPLTVTPGSINDKRCTSSIGWLGMKAYIHAHRPPMVLIENVMRLFARTHVEGGTSAQRGLILRLASHYIPLERHDFCLISQISSPHVFPALRYEQIEMAMTQMGYKVQALVANAAHFGLPQQRNRAWLMCYLVEEAPEPGSLLEDVSLFQCLPLSVSSCVEASESEQRKTRPPRNVDSKMGARPEPKWKAAFEEQCKLLGKVLLAFVAEFSVDFLFSENFCHRIEYGIDS